MYSDSKKGIGLVLGPVKPENPQGDYFVLREDLSIFKIHYYELSQQGDSVLEFRQSNSRFRFLAFDNYSGDLMLVRSATRSHFLGFVLYKVSEESAPNPKIFMPFCYLKKSLSRAPSSFKFIPTDTIVFTFNPDVT